MLLGGPVRRQLESEAAGVTDSKGPSRERLRRYWDKQANSYDRGMDFFERVFFADGREWACSQASGDVLEVAIGTGRNLPFYRPDVRLTGVEFSPAMLEIARERGAALGRQVDLRLGDAQALDPRMPLSTLSCPRFHYAQSRTSAAP